MKFILFVCLCVCAAAQGTIPAGSKATLVATADGTAPLTYQWLRNGVVVGSGSALPITSASATDAATYTVTAGNEKSSATSAPYTLAVTQPPPPVVGPTITKGFGNVTVIKQSPLMLTVTATGRGTLRYVWTQNGQTIQGQTTASLFYARSRPPDAGTYKCTVTDATGLSASTSGVVTIR